jgi:nuclear GTP-binding protein
VPRENVEKWLKYLRNDFPTLAFKCSTQKKGKLGQAAVSLQTGTHSQHFSTFSFLFYFKYISKYSFLFSFFLLSLSASSSGLLQDTSECLGADSLIQLLKNYSRSLNMKTSITVGIIGTLIN